MTGNKRNSQHSADADVGLSKHSEGYWLPGTDHEFGLIEPSPANDVFKSDEGSNHDNGNIADALDPPRSIVFDEAEDGTMENPFYLPPSPPFRVSLPVVGLDLAVPAGTSHTLASIPSQARQIAFHTSCRSGAVANNTTNAANETASLSYEHNVSTEMAAEEVHSPGIIVDWRQLVESSRSWATVSIPRRYPDESYYSSRVSNFMNFQPSTPDRSAIEAVLQLAKHIHWMDDIFDTDSLWKAMRAFVETQDHGHSCEEARLACLYHLFADTVGRLSDRPQSESGPQAKQLDDAISALNPPGDIFEFAQISFPWLWEQLERYVTSNLESRASTHGPCVMQGDTLAETWKIWALGSLVAASFGVQTLVQGIWRRGTVRLPYLINLLEFSRGRQDLWMQLVAFVRRVYDRKVRAWRHVVFVWTLLEGTSRERWVYLDGREKVPRARFPQDMGIRPRWANVMAIYEAMPGYEPTDDERKMWEEAAD
ncbi:hypothetical protein QBC46DRAFT_404957 [Diplogelasinospora grovesii]|uniref:Uncharacterized protein n=1 Tax=Diplogelasinospora grovesii TaxID=303347 RepID=A0AAN6NE12_9PEZI|nr:hypothetical protein QBC46DRAFT_404957 [Diplogelasinospora grovesii]